MSTPGQQPPYGSTPYGPQTPYGQPAQPYGQPAQPYGQPGQAPYGQAPAQPYGQPNPYAPGPSAPGQGGYPAGYGAPGYPPGYPTQAGWPAAPAATPVPQRSLVVVTLDSVPGREVTGVLGEVVGVVARSRELPQELRTPNPLDGYAQMLTRSRRDAVDRMVQQAQAAGADAVVGLRYDSSEITQTLSEVVAYGTAVTLSPAAEAAPDEESPSAEPGAVGDEIRPLDPPDFVGTPDFGPRSEPGHDDPAPGGTQRPAGSSPFDRDAPGQSWPPPGTAS